MNGAKRPANGSSVAMSGAILAGNRHRTIAAARERFVGGDDAVRGVRPEILISWYRCREQYQVDPHLAQAPPAPGAGAGGDDHSLMHDTVLTELGGAAAMAASDAESASTVIITVADSGGRILATWGDRKTLGLAEDSNLAPWSAWPEWTIGNQRHGNRARMPPAGDRAGS